MRRVPCIGILGFLFGCCITVIIALIFIPANEFWPSTYENRLYYVEELTVKYKFIYRSAFSTFNKSASRVNRTFESEEDHLRLRAKMLCYSVEQEADDETHASLILATWAQHCDKTIMFYTSPRLLDKLHPLHLRTTPIELVYVDPSNSTIGTLVRELSKHTNTYKWFTYVPSKVFLIPNNLKYYLVASQIDPKNVTFSGKPLTGKLFGTWAVSDQSPLAMTAGAINLTAKINDPGCFSENIQGKRL